MSAPVSLQLVVKVHRSRVELGSARFLLCTLAPWDNKAVSVRQSLSNLDCELCVHKSPELRPLCMHHNTKLPIL